MSAEEPLIADLFDVDKRLSLKPVVDFNSYLRNAFGEGPCRCHRCTEGGDESTYSHAHTFTFESRQCHRRFASTSGSDVAQVLKNAISLDPPRRRLPRPRLAAPRCRPLPRPHLSSRPL